MGTQGNILQTFESFVELHRFPAGRLELCALHLASHLTSQ